MADKISDKQKQFCLEFIVDFNATKAAIRAGYSPNSAKEQGYRLLTKDHIQEELNALKREIKDKTILTILDLDENIIEMLHDSKNVPIYHEGVTLGFTKCDFPGRGKALELYGKRLKAYTESADVGAKGGCVINIGNE